MFGYVRPDLPNLYIKDSVLYRSMYCGLCKSIAGGCGTVSRFALSYDLAFLSALFHNIMNIDVQIKEERCILHPITKRPMAGRDEISGAIGCLNVLLAYYKLTDDINDQNKGKIRRRFFSKGYRRALKAFPDLEQTVKKRFDDLEALEKQNCDSIDIAADPFSKMLSEISGQLLKEYSTPHTSSLCYNIGKFVYLIDALDDYNKDIKQKNYNVFYNAFQEINFDALIEKHRADIEFIFGGIFNAIKENLSNIKFYFNSDLTDNILLKGMPRAFKKIIDKEKKKCKKTRMKF